ncbi:inactive hydroxysteroid dehydrogenase-like protein 1 [Thrips palmi]|uniref:Inactive hydroxysteroid dehydrogenase-like protein 1 n=1 Tax=Thrips palmi TaxID=161013 RepID=A0A6P8ZMQ9_THRPL|nr:inactive hydroxysteroid dehydrogenase-like protein 1 [Thrips palmi]
MLEVSAAVLGVLALLGTFLLLLMLAGSVLLAAQGMRAHVLPYFNSRPVDLVQRFGAWAVVTGSTDGIGRAYALELARRGVNVCLISRSLDKLRNTAAEIESRFGVKTMVIAADFSKGQSVFEDIEAKLKEIPVGILVNNVGRQYTYPMYLGEVPEQELWDIVNINIGATTMMTRMVLEQMKERRKGVIVNVSSASELQPLPLMTVYAASKVFVKSFSEALRVEYAQYGITVQHLLPLFVNTKMNAFSHRLQETSLFVPDAERYARNAVNTLGQVESTTGYWAHGIQYFFTVIPPVWVRTYVGNLMNQTFRKDYLNASRAASAVSNNNLKIKEIPPTPVAPPALPVA